MNRPPKAATRRRTLSSLSVGLALFSLSGASSLKAAPCSEVPTIADGKAPTRVIFIAPDGNDTTGQGSEHRPYRSLNRAAQNITPGTALRLLPGTYAGGTHLTGLSGTADAPIWIGGLPDRERPVISGGSTGLQLSRARYLIVENLNVTGATANGINCDDGGDYANPEAARFVLFRHLEIHDIGTGGNQDCLKLSGLDDYWVLDCDFRKGSAGGSGIDHVGCHRGVIARCSFADMGSNAIQCKGGSEDITIQWSRFHDAGARAINLGGSTGFEFFRPPLTPHEPNVEARNIRVIANLFVGAETPLAFVGSVDCLVAQNTLVDPRRWIIRMLQETTTDGNYTFAPCGHSRIVNNLIYFSRSELRAFVNIGSNTAPETFSFANNLWYAHDNPAQSTPDLPSPESNGIFGLDPRLRDPDRGDFRVSADSPAIGGGFYLPEATADLLQRCFATPPTLGAYEHPNAVMHPTPPTPNRP